MGAYESKLQEIAAGATPWKLAVRTAAATNLALSGLSSTGGVAIAEGDRVGAFGQTDAKHVGVYIAAAGPWERAPDFNRSSYVRLGTTIRVMEGTNAGLWWLSSPTDGEIRVGVTELVFELESDYGFTPVDFTGLVALAYDQTATYDGSGDCIVGLNTDADFVPGTQFELLIPAGTATGLIYGDNLDPEGTWDVFDSGADYWIGITAVSVDRIVSVGKSLAEPTYATPTIVSAEVSALDLDKLVLTFSEACQFPDESLAGASLGGTMATPRTISSVFSGNGTTEVTLDLSGDLLVTDTPTFVLGSTRTLRALNGVRTAAGSTPITFTDVDYDWASVTGASFDLIASAGIGVADAAAVPAWTDQIDGETTAEATNQAIFRLAPGVLNGNPAVDYDGINDKLVSSATAASWLGAVGDFEVIAAVHADAIVGTTGNFTAEGIFGEGSTRIGMLLYLNGANYTLLAFVYDASPAWKYAEKVIGTSLPAKGFVAEMRLTGGNLIASVNGVDGTPTACGPADAYGSTLKFGTNSAASAFFNGQIARIVGKSGNGTKETAAITAFYNKYCA